jgi:RNA recognition motif-containing protein
MNIYVGNLSQQTSEDDLTAAFAAFGEVQLVRIVRDGATSESKGFGFVTMEDDAHAQAAIDGLNGKELDGKAIKVEKGKTRTESDRGRGGRGSFRGGRGGGGGGRPGGQGGRGGSAGGGGGGYGRRRDNRGGGGGGGGGRREGREGGGDNRGGNRY